MEGDISRLRALLSHLLASRPSESKAEIAPFKQLKNKFTGKEKRDRVHSRKSNRSTCLSCNTSTETAGRTFKMFPELNVSHKVFHLL